MVYVTDRKLWLTADRERVVEDGDPEAASLLASKGKAIPDDVAKRYGLTGKPARPEAVEAAEVPAADDADPPAEAAEAAEVPAADAADPEGKAVADPPDDKAALRAANKAVAGPKAKKGGA
jgi:Rieske Fe-S protein